MQLGSAFERSSLSVSGRHSSRRLTKSKAWTTPKVVKTEGALEADLDDSGDLVIFRSRVDILCGERTPHRGAKCGVETNSPRSKAWQRRRFRRSRPFATGGRSRAETGVAHRHVLKARLATPLSHSFYGPIADASDSAASSQADFLRPSPSISRPKFHHPGSSTPQSRRFLNRADQRLTQPDKSHPNQAVPLPIDTADRFKRPCEESISNVRNLTARSALEPGLVSCRIQIAAGLN
jgi:hypothetical protein